MSKGPPASSEKEYVRGAWEWAAEIGSTSGLAVRYVLHPGGRRGIWLARCEAVRHLEPGKFAVHRRVSAEWPSSYATTLAGELFALTVKLDKALEETPVERAALP